MNHLKVCVGVSCLGLAMLVASAGPGQASAAPAVPGQYGNQSYNRRGLKACEQRLSDKIQREHSGTGRVRTDSNTVEESRESDVANRIRGKGQYQSRDGMRTFSFSCKYSVRDTRVIDIDYNTDDSSGGGYGNDDDRYYDNNARVMTDYPRVRVDTDGRGSFQSQRIGNGNISRGYVDVRSARPTVGFTGPRGFKILFYGDVLQSDGRRMLIRINDSSRGRVRGRAEVQLNNDRNEVESITVQGRDFSGNFGRN